MNRTDAETTIAAYLKPIFGFALRRCRSPQDAEDLSQEIVLRAFRALSLRDDILEPGKFIWTVAHNALSNYYRSGARSMMGVPIEAAETLAAEEGEEEAILARLRGEIASLTKTQRRVVVAYYFENRRQADIAAELGIPVGTVKWHLFEARKELKRGLTAMRKTEELQFRPIRFHSMSINGSPGSKSIDEFFRSSLSQNVCYCVRSEAKTVNEIAADLGVSPVYVESEVDFLEEYGFLTAHKDKYLVNFLLSEPTEALLVRQDAMYKRAAALLADELFEELTDSGLMDDPRILCEQTDGPLDGAPRRDHNFLMWSLIPYIASRSGGRALDKRISFDEVATIRPDGAHNIFSATVMPDHLQLPEDYVHMERWSGPMCCINDGRAIWRVDSQWSERGEKWGIFDSEDVRLLCQYEKEKEHRLSRDEYARLTERGFVKTNGERGERFRAAWQFVVLNGGEIRKELLDIGDRVREKHRAEFDALRAAYITEVLETVPAHVRKMKEYELQFIFQSDGWFLLHCLTHLVNGGKLRLPTPDQRKALGMLMIFE